jgi:hypothetical protein
MLKKMILIVSLLFLIPFQNVSAYEIPENSCVVNLTDSRLGTIDVYIPCNQVSNLSLQNNQIINVNSGSVTGYFTYNGEDEMISFQTFQYGRYRLDGDYQYSYLNIRSINSHNFNFRTQTDNIFDSQSNVITLVAIFIIGGLLWMIYLRR